MSNLYFCCCFVCLFVFSDADIKAVPVPQLLTLQVICLPFVWCLWLSVRNSCDTIQAFKSSRGQVLWAVVCSVFRSRGMAVSFYINPIISKCYQLLRKRATGTIKMQCAHQQVGYFAVPSLKYTLFFIFNCVLWCNLCLYDDDCYYYHSLCCM